MGLLSQTELNPLQDARRVAEEHIDAVREIALNRLKSMPRVYRSDDAAFLAESARYWKVAAVLDALQTIYDSVSELEFEEEEPPEPSVPEADEEPEPEEDEDEDEDPEDDEE